MRPFTFTKGTSLAPAPNLSTAHIRDTNCASDVDHAEPFFFFGGEGGEDTR